VTEAEPAGRKEPAAHHSNEYVVVLRARSSAHFLPEEGCTFTFGLPRGLGRVRVGTFTSWAGGGEHSLPRELVVEVRGRAASLDEAIANFARVGRPIAMMAGSVANVAVGLPEVYIAYDSTADHDNREFLVFLPNVRGGFREWRVIRQDLMRPATLAFWGLGFNFPRVDRPFDSTSWRFVSGREKTDSHTRRPGIVSGPYDGPTVKRLGNTDPGRHLGFRCS
jgi:hypothetical protein